MCGSHLVGLEDLVSNFRSDLGHFSTSAGIMVPSIISRYTTL
jgi:hypothetical protein